MSQQVWVAGVAEADAAADTVLEVVDRAGVVGWLAPEPVDVLRLRSDLRVLVRYAVEHGVVHLADDRSAVVVWLDPPVEGRVVPDLHRLRRSQVDGAAYERRVGLLQQRLWSLAEPPPPWQLLLVVGVEAERRRVGCGAWLVRRQLERLDAAEVTALAFAFDEPTAVLLRSVGFVRIAGTPLPSGGAASLLRRPVGGES